MLYASRFLRLMSPPMEGPDVLWVQRRLKELGYKVEADGIFGPATEEAVKSFQRANGLLVERNRDPIPIKPCRLPTGRPLRPPRQVGQNLTAGNTG